MHEGPEHSEASEREDRRGLWTISWVSFLWAMSSLMSFAVLPAFVTEELGLSHTGVGLMEGLALALAFGSKVFSGALSDLLRRRKALIIGGSLLTLCAKPFLIFAGTSWAAATARCLDRFAKGLRSAPTDALVADFGAQGSYKRVFGVRQSLYTAGAVAGAAAAMLLIWIFPGGYRTVFALSVLPVIGALVALYAYLPEPRSLRALAARRKGWNPRDVAELPTAFWALLIGLSFVMLARFSEAFLALHVRSFGLPLALMPVIIIVQDVVHATMAWVVGQRRFGEPRTVLLVGLGIQALVGFYFMYYATNLTAALAGVGCVGLYMGLTQGVLRAMLAKLTPPHLRGTAFSLFYLCSGCAVLMGNAIAGAVSDAFSLHASFGISGVFTLIALLVLYFHKSVEEAITQRAKMPRASASVAKNRSTSP